MKKYQIESIAAGTRFSADAFIDAESLFVPKGVPVKQKDLDQLRKWGVTHVLSDGGLQLPEDARTAKSAAGEEHDPLSLIRPTAVYENSPSYRLYVDMIERLDLYFKRIASGEDPDKKSLEMIVKSVLEAVKTTHRDMIGFILGGDIQGHAEAKSSVNSTLLSCVMGQAMKLPAFKLQALAQGALLHDIGMLRVPADIVGKQGDLSSEETQKMRAHTLQSYRMIVKELGFPEEVGLVGLQHHERFDGEGYPRRARGTEIDLLARVVSVADAFEAMVSEKPWRNSMIGYQAMRNLLSDNSRRFDPEVLRCLIKCMGIYPIGSIVLLNTSAIARVVDVHPDVPLRPRIRVLIDEYGTQYRKDEGDLVDLVTEKNAFIARAIDPKEFQEG